MPTTGAFAAWRGRCLSHAARVALASLAFGTIAQAQDGAPQPSPAVDEAPGGSVELDPVVVEGEAGSAVTEGTGSFTSPTATVGGKTEAPLNEIPQAISIVTRERIEALNMTQLEDAARRTTGMLVLSNDPGRSSIFTRGFELDTVTIEGLPAPLSSIYGTQQDLAIADRVEFLRGPAGLFTGAGEISGIANIGLKQPMRDVGIAGIASVGSWNNVRGEIDVNAPLVEAGEARLRIVGAFQDRDSFVDVNHNRVGVIYGAAGFDVTPDTTLTVYVWHQGREAIPHNGLPVDISTNLLDVDRSTFVGADWNRFENDIFETIGRLEHVFDNGITANISARYSQRDVDMAYAYGLTAVDPAVGTTRLRGFARRYWEDAFSADAFVSVPFQAFDQTQEVVVGVDYRNYEQTVHQAIVNNIFTYDVFNPTPGLVPEPVFNYTTRTRNNPEQMGFYAQARLRPIEDLTLVLGARETWYSDRTKDLLTGMETDQVDINGELTPFAGFTFDITENVTAFFSYAEIFQPQDNVTTPITGSQYEGGLKFSFFDGALNASASIYRLLQSNRAVLDTDTLEYFAAGRVRSQGFEVEVSGNITENLDVFAGYAYTETQYVQDPAVPAGLTFSTITPDHNVNLWARYSFGEEAGILDGFHIAGGMRAVSGFFSNAIDAPGYIVFDAQIGYEITENVDATLTVSNLFDETYYDRVGGNGLFNFYGPPRSVLFSLSANF